VDDQILPGGGEIVEQDDVQALATRIRAWVADCHALERRRSPARARAEEMFDIRRTSEQLWNEYLTLIRQTDSSR